MSLSAVYSASFLLNFTAEVYNPDNQKQKSHGGKILGQCHLAATNQQNGCGNYVNKRQAKSDTAANAPNKTY